MRIEQGQRLLRASIGWIAHEDDPGAQRTGNSPEHQQAETRVHYSRAQR